MSLQDHEPKCDECGHILPLAGPCKNCGGRPTDRLHVYIAGSFRDRNRVRNRMYQARVRGLHVVHDWPSIIESVPGEDGDLADDEARKHALGDIEAIRQAHVLWFLAPPEGEGRGSWVELGIAYQMGLPIIVSGEHARGSIFTALGTRFADDETALDYIVGAEHCRKTGESEQPDPVPYDTATGDTYPGPGVWANPARCGGEPCIEGHRIPTATIRRCFVGGWNVDQILDEYPSLDRGQVEGALRFELGRDPEDDDEEEPTVAECGVPKCNEPATHCLHHSDHPDTAGDRLAKLDAATARAISDLAKRLQALERELTEDNDDGLLRRIEWIEARASAAAKDLGADGDRPLKSRVDQLERDLARLQGEPCPNGATKED